MISKEKIERILNHRYHGKGAAYYFWRNVKKTRGAGWLLLAAQRYDAGRGIAFTTFSSYWIHACIWKAASAAHIVRLDTTEAKRRIAPRVRKLMRGAEIRDLDPAAIAAELDVNVAEVEEVITRLRAQPFDVRLDAMTPGRGGVPRLHEMIDNADRADELAEARQLVRAVEAALDRLALDDPRCAEIVRERIEHEDGPTLAQIGRRYGLTRERMRQLEAKGLARVREELGL